MSLPPGSGSVRKECSRCLATAAWAKCTRRATDRLDRLVAVKILLPVMAVSSDARERFEREARAISRLSHPHVCALFDVGREATRCHLVMELVDGETLSALVAKGPLPTSEILRIGGRHRRGAGGGGSRRYRASRPQARQREDDAFGRQSCSTLDWPRRWPHRPGAAELATVVD